MSLLMLSVRNVRISSITTKKIIFNRNNFSTSSVLNNKEQNNDKKHYDIIIAGGGMVGLTLACSLSKNTKLADKSILLLEGAKEFKGYSKTTYSNRVSALNKGAIDLLNEIGAWDTIKSIRCKPVKEMQVWDANSDALITFNHENHANNVAFIVENDVLIDSVILEIQNCCKNVEIKNSAQVETVCLPKNTGTNLSTIVLKSGENYSCDLLIGADGGNSVVRNTMGVDNFTLSYNQMGVVATVELEETNNNNGNSTAWQRFLPSGPVALLPLTDKLSSLVWSTSTIHAKQLLQMPDNEFIDALNSAFCKQLQHNQIVTNVMKGIDTFLPNPNKGLMRQYPPMVKTLLNNSRAGFPLSFGHASTYVVKGAALIGDAAHKVHPLAGQGVNLGFGDIKCLVGLLSDAIYRGGQLGDTSTLCKYERTRLQNNVPIMLGVHGIQRLYSTDFPPVVMLRSIGLHVTHSVPLLKKFFMEKAMA